MILEDTRSWAQLAGKTALERKGEKIVILDMREVTLVADYFVIVSGHTVIQVALTTCACWANAWANSSSVVVHGKLPTYNVFDIVLPPCTSAKVPDQGPRHPEYYSTKPDPVMLGSL